MLATNICGQSSAVTHLQNVAMRFDLMSTSFALVRNRKKNKIKVGTNLRVLAIFIFSLVNFS
jgi:hypothetical protein